MEWPIAGIDFRIVKLTCDNDRTRYRIERYYPSLNLTGGDGWAWEDEYKHLWCAKRRLRTLRRWHKLDTVEKEVVELK
jgi:hypothetical protein